MIEQLISCEEAAKILNISVYSVKQRIRAGRFPGVKVGGKWKVRKRDVEEMTVIDSRYIEEAIQSAGITTELSDEQIGKLTAILTSKTFPSITKPE